MEHFFYKFSCGDALKTRDIFIKAGYVVRASDALPSISTFLKEFSIFCLKASWLSNLKRCDGYIMKKQKFYKKQTKALLAATIANVKKLLEIFSTSYSKQFP